MQDSKLDHEDLANGSEIKPRSDKNCCERAMSCIADFFECDRRLFLLDRPAYEEEDWENFDESTTARTRKYSKHPLDIKLQSEDRLDENRVASCCTLQWWIDFLCCRSEDKPLEQEQSVGSEKHLKLNEKTIQDLEYEKDNYAIDVKQSEVGSYNQKVSKPKTADRTDQSRGKLNILMHDNNKEDQLDNIDLDKNSSSVSPVSVQKVDVKPWKGKGKRSQPLQEVERIDDGVFEGKSRTPTTQVNDLSENKPLAVFTNKNKPYQPTNNNEGLIFFEDNPIEGAIKSSGKEKQTKVDREKEGGHGKSYGRQSAKQPEHYEQNNGAINDYTNQNAESAIFYRDDDDSGKIPTKENRKNEERRGKSRKSRQGNASKNSEESSNPTHTGFEQSGNNAAQSNILSTNQEEVPNPKTMDFTVTPPLKKRTTNSFEADEIIFEEPQLVPEDAAEGEQGESTDAVASKKKKKKKNIMGDAEKRNTESLVVGSSMGGFKQPEELPYSEQFDYHPREEGHSPQPSNDMSPTIQPGMDDIKKRKRNKFVRQEQAPAEEIVIDQVTDIKKKKRTTRPKKQQYIEEVELDGEQEPVEQKPKRKREDNEN